MLVPKTTAVDRAIARVEEPRPRMLTAAKLRSQSRHLPLMVVKVREVAVVAATVVEEATVVAMTTVVVLETTAEAVVNAEETIAAVVVNAEVRTVVVVNVVAAVAAVVAVITDRDNRTLAPTTPSVRTRV